LTQSQLPRILLSTYHFTIGCYTITRSLATRRRHRPCDRCSNSSPLR